MYKIILPLALALTSSLAIAQHMGHPGGGMPPMSPETRVVVQPESKDVYNAGIIQYSFKLLDSQTNKNVSDKDLVLDQTKLVHFIAYDSSRNEFTHVHPTFDGAKWNVELNLPTNGKYYLWAQGKLVDGIEFSNFTNAQVVNGNPEIATVTLKDVRKATVSSTTVTLDKIKIKAGKNVMINFAVTREDGQAVQLSPYLGALAHVIAVSSANDELIHVHPVAGQAPNTGVLHSLFPKPGDYRIWVQLIENNELKVFPLSVIVVK